MNPFSFLQPETTGGRRVQARPMETTGAKMTATCTASRKAST